MNKRWLIWAVVALLCTMLVIGIVRRLSAQQVQKESLQAQQLAKKGQTTMQLSTNDLVTASTVTLTQVLEISGPLKATQSAVVKARVAGELQGMALREGDFVQAGSVIARIDPTEYQARLRQAQQQAESARAQIDIAQRNFDNNRALVEQGFISKTALDSSIATLASAEASYRAAQAGTEVAQKALDDTILRAPISGQIAQRLTQPGERVAIDGRVVEIVDLRHLELEASLSAADSLKIKLGQSATLAVEGASQPLSANVARINPSAQAGSRAVLAYLAVQASEGLRQGLFAQGEVATATVQVLALPLGSVRTDKPQPYVQWVNDDNEVRHQTVELGRRGNSQGIAMVEVRGIAEGSKVLAGSLGSLRAGTLVQMSNVGK